MYIISVRDSIWNDNKFSINDVVMDDSGIILNKDDLLAACTNRRVLVLVHGYYSPRKRLIRTYQIIEQQLHQHGMGVGYTVVGFVWPGGSQFWHYLWSKDRSSEVGFRLQSWLWELGQVASALDVNTHSLGARCLFYALKEYPDVRVRNAFVLAPAVDDECLQSGEKFDSVPYKCDELVGFYSRHDPVLRFAYPLNDLDLALGNRGPQNESKIEASNVRFVDCTEFVDSHGRYKDRPEVYAVMKEYYGS